MECVSLPLSGEAEPKTREGCPTDRCKAFSLTLCPILKIEME